MDEATFQTLADETLTSLMDRIEAAADEAADVDLEGGILTIDLETGAQYLINTHAPNRQIWVSSPQSGAGHYGFDQNTRRWINTRDGSDLHQLLSRELASAFNQPVELG